VDLAEVAYVSARALFQAAIAAPDEAGAVLEDADPFEAGRSAA
jgi:hypothetical protein